MNIKALIKKYEAVECVVGIISGKTILKTVLRDLKQLDEPEKVKVPQFVAEKIEYFKKTLESFLSIYLTVIKPSGSTVNSGLSAIVPSGLM